MSDGEKSRKAVLVIGRRLVYGDRDFAEAIVWRVPEPVAPSSHRLKYRLAYVVDGRCVLRFDNERGKGDHRHDGEREIPYRFETVERLMADFAAAIEQWRVEHGRN